MAFENLFIRTKKFIGDIQLDAVISEAHSNTVEVTDNPVELGANISDHAIILPKKITITADVSDTPLGFAAVNQIIDNVSGLFGSSTSPNITRSTAAYSALVQLMEELEPIEIQTKLVLYKNMIITNIDTRQDKDSSRIVSLVISAREVLITESQVIKLEASQLEDGSPKEQGTSAEKKGRQEAQTPTDAVNRSVLKSITDWVQ